MQALQGCFRSREVSLGAPRRFEGQIATEENFLFDAYPDLDLPRGAIMKAYGRVVGLPPVYRFTSKSNTLLCQRRHLASSRALLNHLSLQF